MKTLAKTRVHPGYLIMGLGGLVSGICYVLVADGLAADTVPDTIGVAVVGSLLSYLLLILLVALTGREQSRFAHLLPGDAASDPSVLS
jgi:hypothetical protein